MKEIPVTTLTMKEKICKTCGMQKACADLSGFCAVLYYAPIVAVLVTVTYYIFSM
ncbi:hypothetical protein ACFL3P_03875 [Pseudomonadota bacterium]